jgi:hypothetical protein
MLISEYSQCKKRSIPPGIARPAQSAFNYTLVQ